LILVLIIQFAFILTVTLWTQAAPAEGRGCGSDWLTVARRCPGC
jgi:hypothetical protein